MIIALAAMKDRVPVACNQGVVTIATFNSGWVFDRRIYEYLVVSTQGFDMPFEGLTVLPLASNRYDLPWV